MVDEWYFAWEEREFGPFSAEQLKALAASGRLQPTDVVWMPGMTTRVQACKVKNLFRAAEAALRNTEVHASPTPPEAVVPVPQAPQEVPTQTPPPSPPPAPATNPTQPAVVHKKKGKATAGPGVVIISQDGERAQYKKKCLKCGFEDPTRHSLAIRNGVIRSPFFCPKCRKTVQLELHCTTH